jgi:hypothetical protein
MDTVIDAIIYRIWKNNINICLPRNIKYDDLKTMIILPYGLDEIIDFLKRILKLPKKY